MGTSPRNKYPALTDAAVTVTVIVTLILFRQALGRSRSLGHNEYTVTVTDTDYLF